MLEVDLEYTQKLHDLHNGYPLAPEKIVVNGVEKVISTLYDKKNYVVHYKNLQLYLSLGLKLKKFTGGSSSDNPHG